MAGDAATMKVLAERLPVAPLVPHAGSMCLLEWVVAFDERRIICSTTAHRSPSNPLRSADRLAALHIAEYGAQAMAAHGALVATGSRASRGVLVSLRNLELHASRLDTLEHELLVEASRLTADSKGQIYDFRATCAQDLVASGRVAVMLQQVAGFG